MDESSFYLLLTIDHSLSLKFRRADNQRGDARDLGVADGARRVVAHPFTALAAPVETGVLVARVLSRAPARAVHRGRLRSRVRRLRGRLRGGDGRGRLVA